MNSKSINLTINHQDLNTLSFYINKLEYDRMFELSSSNTKLGNSWSTKQGIYEILLGNVGCIGFWPT
jgi:hypothetical protein